MTPEEKRERLLKRLLPTMVVTIIYFVFISGLLSEKMTKAEDKYTALKAKGISPTSVPGIISQQSKTNTQIRTLEKQNKEFKEKLKDLAGFLSHTTPSNQSSTLLSDILAKNKIRVRKEQRETFSEEALSPALNEVWQWLKPTDENNEKIQKVSATISVQHLSLSGSYQNMYLAMATIAQGHLKAIPVSFTMTSSEEENALADTLDWELLLWM